LGGQSNLAKLVSRRHGRELVVQFLYQVDLNKDCDLEKGLESFLEKQKLTVELAEFIKNMVSTLADNKTEVDNIIQQYTDNWVLDRIAVVDRNILRMAVCELLFLKDIPPNVSINEAVDLAKKFSTVDSGRFVNGVLDKVKKEYYK